MTGLHVVAHRRSADSTDDRRRLTLAALLEREAHKLDADDPVLAEWLRRLAADAPRERAGKDVTSNADVT